MEEDDPLDMSIIVDDSALAQQTLTPEVWFRSGDKRNLQNVFGAVANEPISKKRTARAMDVMVRIRPTKEPISDFTVVKDEYLRKIRTATKEFEFSAVLPPETSQSEMYDAVIRPYVEGFQTGESAMVFCYGRTNAGKTHTVMGNLTEAKQWGLVPRVLHEFLSAHKSVQFAMFEVYNEFIHDLIPGGTKSIKEQLLRNVSEHIISDAEILMKTLEKGRKARITANNQINAQSSRSHAILRIQLPCSEPNATPTHLWIVDLAGSEKAKKAKLFHEAVKINSSLAILNRCFLALREGKPPPLRESKLTRILGSHWKSKFASRTTMLVNLGHGPADTVLQYASVAAKAVIALPADPAKKQQVQYDGNGRVKRTITNVIRKLSPKRPPATKPPEPMNFEERLAELQEVIQECEDEMARMRNVHAEELEATIAHGEANTLSQVNAIKQRYEALFDEKEAQVKFLQEQIDELLKSESDARKALKQQKLDLAEKDSVIDEIETEHQEIIAEKDSAIENLKEENARLKFQLEEVQSRETTSSDSPAKETESENEIDSSEASEKKQPLKMTSGNTIKPPGRRRLDPITGTYLRPRGKAPKGATSWDDQQGVWLTN